MISNDFMPLSLDALQKSRAYGGETSTPTVEELEKMGYTVSDPNEDFGLDFSDFMQLMITQLQNQTIDNAADTSDMLNQLVQMSIVQMMSNVKTSLDTLSNASTLTYAASLVGKTVTVGSYDDDGNLQEIVGEVTATGTYQGIPVIFVDDEMYPLSNIIAVGTLPEDPDEGGTDPGEGGTDPGEGGTDPEGGVGDKLFL